MTIKDVLSFLNSHTVAAERMLSDREIADMRNVVNEYLRVLPRTHFEERWRAKVALYIAELFYENFHEVYLADEFKAIKKTFSSCEESVLNSLKKDVGSKRVCSTQLSALYKLFEYYIRKMQRVAEFRGYRKLKSRLGREAKLMHERYVLHAGKYSVRQSLSFYQLIFRKKFKKHYYMYAIITGIGIVAFWHGFWGIFDILGLHPFITAGGGIAVLVMTGVVMHEFLGMRKSWPAEDKNL